MWYLCRKTHKGKIVCGFGHVGLAIGYAKQNPGLVITDKPLDYRLEEWKKEWSPKKERMSKAVFKSKTQTYNKNYYALNRKVLSEKKKIKYQKRKQELLDILNKAL